MMLAQANPEPSTMNQTMLMVAFIASVLFNIVGIVTMIIQTATNRKQRSEVTPGFVPASKEALDHLASQNAQEHRDLFSKIGGVERGAAANLQRAIDSGNVSREALHHRINDLLKAISHLEGQIE